MKTSIKTLAYAAIASIAFLACDDIDTSNKTELGGSISSSSSTDNCVAHENEDGSGDCLVYKEPEVLPPYDTERIESVVKEWMEKQLASGKNDRMLIYVHDLYSPEYESGAGYINMSSYEMYYVLGGRPVDKKEFDEWVEKFRKEMEEKRGITPMGEIVIGGSGSGWVAAMTAEEIVELTEKYKELSVEFYPIYVTNDPND